MGTCFVLFLITISAISPAVASTCVQPVLAVVFSSLGTCKRSPLPLWVGTGVLSLPSFSTFFIGLFKRAGATVSKLLKMG